MEVNYFKLRSCGGEIFMFFLYNNFIYRVILKERKLLIKLYNLGLISVCVFYFWNGKDIVWYCK